MSPVTEVMQETGIVPRIRWFVATGGAAGDITVTGINLGDKLSLVLNLTDLVDLTSEFSITAANTINNAGGTATTGDALLVCYFDNPNAP